MREKLRAARKAKGMTQQQVSPTIYDIPCPRTEPQEYQEAMYYVEDLLHRRLSEKEMRIFLKLIQGAQPY